MVTPDLQTLPTTDPLTSALRRALETERDPQLRDWLQALLRGDTAQDSDHQAAAPRRDGAV